ncbi:hypothetical protein DV735_g556, partial [Chaetothyriales sp. CBS 134920]
MRSAAALSLLITAGVASLFGESDDNHTCVIQRPVLSCSSNAVPGKVDSCCAETFGGLVLSTQFWSTYTGLESEGQLLPPKSWTLHGLWPDFCNGSYTQYCDLSRQYDPVPSPNTTTGLANGTVVPPYTGPDIGTFVEAFRRYDLLDWMNRYWINQGAPNSDFWGHEFSKHATCFSTFDLPCYGPDYVEHQDVVDFFETAILFFQRLPTYRWLAEAGITPSNKTAYSLSDFQTVLTEAYGAEPFIGCTGPRYNTTTAGAGSNDSGRTVLSEVWYYSHVKGRSQRGESVPVGAGSYNTTCAHAEGAILYPERTQGTSTTPPIATVFAPHLPRLVADREGQRYFAPQSSPLATVSHEHATGSNHTGDLAHTGRTSPFVFQQASFEAGKGSKMSKITRQIKNVTKGYSSVQVKVRNATSNDAWGPTGTEMSEIAALTFNNPSDFYDIMDMLDKRLNDKGKNWRHVLKSLKVLDYCLHEGSELVVTWARKNIYIIKTLREFQYVDEDGKDVGNNVRVSAKELTSLILDDDRLRSERSDRKLWKTRVTGIDEYGPQAIAGPAQPTGRSRRNTRQDEEDAEMRLAIEASKFEAEEDAKRRARDQAASGGSDDDLAKAIRLSKEEEALRVRQLEDHNSASLLDDTPAPSQPQPTGYNQGYQQQPAVDWSGNPLQQQPQATGFLNNQYAQPQQTAFPTGFSNGFAPQQTGFEQLGQQPFLQQQNTLQTLQPQQTAFQTNNPYAFPQQPTQTSLFDVQPQQYQQAEQIPQPGSHNPWAANEGQQQPLQPLPTGSNNPFAQKTQQAQTFPARTQPQPSLGTLYEQQSTAQFNPITSYQSPAPQQQPQQPARPADQQYARLNALLASGEGTDTFGNVGDLRIPAQHTAPGQFINSAGVAPNRLAPTTTGTNPFFSQQFGARPQVPAQTGPVGSTVDPSKALTIIWTSSSSDPRTITFKLENSDSSNTLASSNQVLASNVPSQQGRITVSAYTIATFGTGYKIVALSDTSGDEIAVSDGLVLADSSGSVTTLSDGALSFVSTESATGSADASFTIFTGTATAIRDSTTGTLSVPTSSTQPTGAAANTNTANRLGVTALAIPVMGRGEVVMGAAGAPADVFECSMMALMTLPPWAADSNTEPRRWSHAIDEHNDSSANAAITTSSPVDDENAHHSRKIWKRLPLQNIVSNVNAAWERGGKAGDGIMRPVKKIRVATTATAAVDGEADKENAIVGIPAKWEYELSPLHAHRRCLPQKGAKVEVADGNATAHDGHTAYSGLDLNDSNVAPPSPTLPSASPPASAPETGDQDLFNLSPPEETNAETVTSTPPTPQAIQAAQRIPLQDQDDTAYLQSFVSRTWAQREATTDIERPSSPCRRSSRLTRLLPAEKRTATLPNTIALRRLNGTEFVAMQKEARSIATATRANTKKNKGGAMNVRQRLIQLQAEKHPPVDDQRQKAGKSVIWSETIARMQGVDGKEVPFEPDQKPEPEMDVTANAKGGAD